MYSKCLLKSFSVVLVEIPFQTESKIFEVFRVLESLFYHFTQWSLTPLIYQHCDKVQFIMFSIVGKQQKMSVTKGVLDK